VIQEDFIEEVEFEGREGASEFQEERTASAKAPQQQRSWCTQKH
jgi:hypothetical protein